MDSSNGNANYKLQAIRDAMETGTLTKEEINRRLTHAISEEYQKEVADRDSRYILACEKTLFEMHTGKPYVSPKEVSQQALLKKLENETVEKENRTPRVARRIVIAVCTLLVLILAADVSLYRERLEGTSTENEQQFVVSGEIVDLEALSSGVADSVPTAQSLQTTDFKEVKKLLGFAPEMINSSLPGWSLNYYSVVISPSSSSFTATYVNDAYENAFLFSIKYYNDLENAQNWIEQNQQGRMINIDNKEVYFAENLDNSICFWSSGSTCYSLFGPLSQKQLISIITSIQGAYEYE